nr:uncharacterized protein LOC123756422 isoform X1 [Procambarus clarkii]XP_045595534.1 uncharacterized protein LOC123756422 isoform X1 [Procambarus clarkii]
MSRVWECFSSPGEQHRMATDQCKRVSSPNVEDQISETWSSIFINGFGTMTYSTVFVKQLVSVALSTITYLRALFPEDAYSDKYVGGVNLKLLMSRSQHIGPNSFVENIEACFDALEKQYLRELNLIIYEQDPDFPLELYVFKFHYTGGSAVLSYFKGFNKLNEKMLNIQVCTMKMLRSIIMKIQEFDQLPDSVSCGFKLLYYDDVTPSDYEPVGFVPVITCDTKFSSHPVNIKMGSVQTSHHKVSLNVSTAYNGSLLSRACDTEYHPCLMLQSDTLDLVNGNEHPRVKKKSSPCYELDIHRSLKAVSGAKRKKIRGNLGLLRNPERSPTLRKNTTLYSAQHTLLHQELLHKNFDNSDINSTSWLNTASTKDKNLYSLFGRMDVIRCPCGVCKEDGPTITCVLCNLRQHAACFKLLDVKDTHFIHVCELCTDTAHPCTDYTLVNTDLAQVRETCLFRRLLVHLRNDTNYHTPASLAQLLHVSTNVGKRLMVRLQSEGALVCEPCNDPRGRLVDQTMLLLYVIPYVFGKNDLPSSPSMYSPSLQIIRDIVS